MNPRPEYNRLYGGTYALTCAESFLTKRGRTWPYVYWTALVMCAGALLALPIIHVDVTVQERGRVRPATERTAIVARTAGFISSIRVHDNDLVHAGDILLTLKTQGLQAKVNFNDSQTKVLNKELADLRYLLERVGNKRPVLVSDLQTGQYISEYQKFDTDCRNANLKVDHTEREMNRNKQLLAIKVVAARDFEESSYQANAARVERETLNHQTIARWQTDRVQKEHELEQLESEALQLADERNLYSIKAPLDGAVVGLEGVVEGSYVQSGQRIGDISPTSDFVVDVSVPPKDIGRIFVGQPVNIQVDAYPYTIWGLLPGRTITISADYVQESESNGAFKVIVHPDRDYLRTRGGLTGSLKKGMTANARFFVARRSLWELVYQSMDDLFNPALKNDSLPPDHPQSLPPNHPK
ncbi:MAG TPA: HlyD family efflux transporter periplasmic adaptor subunit [Chthoniobacterales bacterium]|jgi:HlyD family secretion protein|nr:HlyD family efflux transporter periplasmic adaptor subunit [Chthoniobacterales bacterium]